MAKKVKSMGDLEKSLKESAQNYEAPAERTMQDMHRLDELQMLKLAGRASKMELDELDKLHDKLAQAKSEFDELEKDIDGWQHLLPLVCTSEEDTKFSKAPQKRVEQILESLEQEDDGKKMNAPTETRQSNHLLSWFTEWKGPIAISVRLAFIIAVGCACTFVFMHLQKMQDLPDSSGGKPFIQVAVLDFIGPIRGGPDEADIDYSALGTGSDPLQFDEIEPLEQWASAWGDTPEVRIIHNVSMGWFRVTTRREGKTLSEIIRIQDKDLKTVFFEIQELMDKWYGNSD